MTTCEIHFRRDPREWSETDTSLQAALVRRHVLQTASDTDEQRIREAIDGIFAKQGPKGIWTMRKTPSPEREASFWMPSCSGPTRRERRSAARSNSF